VYSEAPGSRRAASKPYQYISVIPTSSKNTCFAQRRTALAFSLGVQPVDIKEDVQNGLSFLFLSALIVYPFCAPCKPQVNLR
jgi:hypothetical protein